MRVLIPMAGTGNRFVQAGYTEPKPLIKVNNKRTIEYLLEMFDPQDQITFICNETHLKETSMRKILTSLRPEATIIEITNHKLGPVHTILQALKVDPTIIHPDEEALIAYCDVPAVWNYTHFKQEARKTQGMMVSHLHFHPHRLAKTLMAHMLTTPDNKVLQVKEKGYFTHNQLNEHASTGIYYFRQGNYITHYFQQSINQNLTCNNEFFITLVYNLLIQDQLEVKVYPVETVLNFGTPEEVEQFESWAKIIQGNQVHNEEEALECYRYWANYLKPKGK